MTKFQKKPIEAVQWTGQNTEDIKKFCGPMVVSYSDVLKISTPEGAKLASPNDWIIKGVAGEFYPCKPDIFEQTYERID